MAGIYRPTIIRYVDSRGGRGTRTNPVTSETPGARPIRVKSKTYWGRVADADGKVCPIKLCDDAEAAEEMLAALKQRAKRIKRGDIDPFEDHRSRPLAEHLKDFETALLAKAATAKQAGQATARCRKIIDSCGFKKLADLSPSAVANYLRERRQAGLGTATSNGYLSGIKSFANWLVKDRRLPSNPLAHLAKLNDRVDIRHERRALASDELARLVTATEKSQEAFRELDGSTRAMLYRLAAMTGLRASELASLTPASFDLRSDPPMVTVQAACSKHRREDVLPIHADLAARLRQWLTERERQQDGQRTVLAFDRVADAKLERLFPGTWATRAFKMFHLDLDVARTAWLDEAKGNVAEWKQRSDSTFLCPVDDAGRVADFHSLRHTFISNLVAGGVHPKLAQQLARHSSITLTMDRYSHVGLLDMNSALESLPTITTTDPQTMRATGTTDDASAVGCTVGCKRPADLPVISRSQPVAMSTADDSPEMRKTTRKRGVSRGSGDYPREDSNLQPSAPEFELEQTALKPKCL